MTQPLDARQGTMASAAEGIVPPIPEHELIRLIGAGSSGQVWLARNALGTYRAVKIVRKQPSRPDLSFNREFEGVLKFEPVSRLHDGLVDILQVGADDTAGYFYCVMELADDIVTGQTIVPARYKPRTLAHDLAERHRLPIGECVRVGSAIASALGFLHRHDLIHRDIKPSNIIFVNGFPKLADIGLVTAISESRLHVGTEGFIPPEGAGTPQADVYSFGKVLYELSTGKDRNEYPALPADLGETAEDQDLIQFNKIVLRACRASPTQRFRSAEELMIALLSFQFCTCSPRREKARKISTRLVSIGGLLVGLGFFAFLLYRLIWLLKQ
jgi:eukaryotic-like serine/threonine-protein kinase